MKNAWGARAAALTLLCLVPTSALGMDRTKTLEIDEAVAYALAHRPALSAAMANVDEARGRRTTAATYPYNSTLGGSAAARLGSGRAGLDFEVELSQRIQLAGQLSKRKRAAQLALNASEKSAVRAKKRIATEVRLAFVQALQARDLATLAARDLNLVEELFALAQRRLDAGAGTLLDLNASASELAQTQTLKRRANAAYRAATARLSERIGLDPLTPIQLQGHLELDPTPPAEEASLLRRAMRTRADLQARAEQVQSAQASLAHAQAARWPDLSIRAFAGQENSRETIVGGGISMPIPWSNRNQGGVEQQRAALTRVRAERRALSLLIRREVISGLAHYEASIENAKTMKSLVRGTLEPNLTLLRRAFEAGKATWPEVLVLRRTFIEAQRALIRAKAEVLSAKFQLELACGTIVLPGKGAPS